MKHDQSAFNKQIDSNSIALNFSDFKMKRLEYLQESNANLSIFFLIANMAQKYDVETYLTRMLLTGMIEYLMSSVQP